MNLASIRARCAAAWPSIRYHGGQGALFIVAGVTAISAGRADTSQPLHAAAFWVLVALAGAAIGWAMSRAQDRGWLQGARYMSEHLCKVLEEQAATRRLRLRNSVLDHLDRETAASPAREEQRVKYETTPGRIDRRQDEIIWPDPQADGAPAREEGGANG